MGNWEPWRGLPDPRPENHGRRLEIEFPKRAWSHCLKHWTACDEPWEDEFGADVVRALRASGDETLSDPAVLGRVLTVLREQATETLRRPQVMLLRYCGKLNKGQRWMLVLPSGALAVLYGGNSRLVWITCYYFRAAAVEKRRRRRWQIAVRHLIRVYVPIQGNPPRCLLPDENEEFTIAKKDTAIKVCHRRFVAPNNWGFCEELTGTPWRGRLSSWPAAEPEEDVPATRKRRLKKRSFRWDEEFDQ